MKKKELNKLSLKDLETKLNDNLDALDNYKFQKVLQQLDHPQKIKHVKKDIAQIKTLIKEFINIDISKQFQSSDFGGELTPAQLKYCANDVLYLHKIHDELNMILERENRIKLYHESLKFLKTRVDLDLALFKEDIWSH